MSQPEAQPTDPALTTEEKIVEVLANQGVVPRPSYVDSTLGSLRINTLGDYYDF